MNHFRIAPIALALAGAALLGACNTAPVMPMASASAQGMAAPGQMASMDAQMKTM